ncbi:MAG: DUF805 domain-containing protein [Humidesulfovibrio sp.]|nr:DUF805 domain-containing protein [Humidesulfovibrio sp.]
MLCPYCKEEIKDGALRCKHCQATLQPGPAGQNTVFAETAGGYDASRPFLDWQNLKYVLLAYDGRLNRAKYWAALGTLLAGGMVASMILPALGMLFWFCAAYSHIVIGIKRLHDLDRSGHWMWLTLVPLLNLYVAFLMLFIPGTRGTNRFGEDLLPS